MMKWMIGSCIALALFVSVGASRREGETKESGMRLYPELAATVKARIGEFEQIPAARKEQLKEIATFVRDAREKQQPIRMTFICTHNSRRSHLAHLWATVAAAHYGIEKFEGFSGGTEATAFNPRAVAAIRRAGFVVKSDESAKNPRYEVRIGPDAPAIACFSKVYSEGGNPSKDFCAVMVCGQADASCPIVSGATARIALPYDDPKVSDGTPAESATYDERCAQIAREMLYAMSMVK
ncbi:MAG: protein-tyrosine-phosphatase [Phycisphaerae bacterium]|nr:protein-tyrosine-phosphatase [Phycisphaerae bacterium]